MHHFIIKSNQSQQIIITKSGDYTITLAGEGAHAEILSAHHLTGAESIDINLTIVHAATHTSADTVIRAVLDDQSIANIQGTIIVEKDAQQTNSYLQENILMLSDKARANAIPNLEIHADDVKCSHAATVGKIPDEHLFYLQSRGIPENKAKKLIADGFLAEVTNREKPISRSAIKYFIIHL